jgi:hypothetical protein
MIWSIVHVRKICTELHHVIQVELVAAVENKGCLRDSGQLFRRH